MTTADKLSMSIAVNSGTEAPGDAPAHQQQRDAMKDTSILIVDDEAANRDILSRRLAREGYTVAQAASGRDALAMMQVESYDLVLLDIMMPEMDGYAVLGAIKTEARWRDTPVIMLSALDDPRSTERCLDGGAYDYLIKPYELNALKARMWRCFHERGLARHTPDQQQAQHVLLVVEDEEFNRDLLSRRVEKLGHTVLTAATGAEALRVLEQRHVDLVLLDIMLPQMDGFELLDAIRARPLLDGVVIIMVSALGDGANLARSVELGASDFVVKPYNAVLLKEKIARGLALRVQRRREFRDGDRHRP